MEVSGTGLDVGMKERGGQGECIGEVCDETKSVWNKIG